MRYYFVLFCFFSSLFADPLPSWNEGPAKKAILSFVAETTQGGGGNYIPPKDRIAVFDEDGTLWIEQPLYVELFFILDRVKQLASKHPEWKNDESIKSLQQGDIESLKGYTEKDIASLPSIAFGNSTGDQQMLEWTQSNSGKTLQLLVHHDDEKREYAYGPDSKIGTFSDALMDEANKKNWIVISMKNDWNVIFPPEKPKGDTE